MGRKLGQHFLISGKALERIAYAACGERTDLVVEIGPGRGALTEALLRRANRVVAIELDRDLAAAVEARWPQVEIVAADALSVDWSQWGAGVLAGNLPYYVSTPIISRYLRHPGPLRQAVFLIQKEVADRIAAKPGSRDYGYFSVECQLLAEVERLFTVAPGAFRPPPKVDSAVIRLKPRTDIQVVDVESFLKFASQCFRQKRKTLRNNLSGVYNLPADPILSRRAEQLTIEELIALHAQLNP